MSITDVAVFIFSLLFFFNGWAKGLMRILLSPVSLLIGTALSYVYYLHTRNLLIALILGIILPFILNILLLLILKFWNQKVDKKMPPSFPSRIAGSLLGLGWGIGMIVLTLLLLAIIPANVFPLAQIQKDLRRSFSYHLLQKFTDGLPTVEDTSQALSEINDEEKIKQIKTSEEYRTLNDDPQLQAIFNDTETMREIREKDLGKLLTNPKFLEILNDEKLLRKMFALHKKIVQQAPEVTKIPAKPEVPTPTP